MEAIEEAFSCVLVHHPTKETDKVAVWLQELRTAMTGLTKEQQEAAVRHFLSMAAAMTNHRRLQLLLSLLENLVHSNYLPARYIFTRMNAYSLFTFLWFFLHRVKLFSMNFFLQASVRMYSELR